MKPVLPKHLCDIEALEAIYGPPERTLTEGDLKSYQRWMAQTVVELPGVLLGAEMGLGKTGATLKGIVDCMAQGIATRWLVVAPLKVAEETWPEEIQKWDFARHLTFRVVTGTADERKAAFSTYPRTDLTIVNRENLRWLLRYVRPERWPWDGIVYDEASRLKQGKLRTNPKPRQDGTQAPPALTELGILDRVRGRTKRLVELSGTPSPNGLIDLYGPIYAIDQGQRLGKSKNAFHVRWFDQNPYTREMTPKIGAEQEIMGKLKDVFFSLKEEDYISLPPLIPVDHYVTMPPKLLDKYREFEREMAIEVLNKWDEEEIIEAVNRGVLTGKLLQFANGSLYNSEKDVIPIHGLKLDVLESIMEEAAGAPVLVAYSFQFDKDAIRKRFPYVRVYGESKNDQRDWNAGKIRMMLTHPASAGHGLNFQYASNIAVWYGLTWSSELYQQFKKRLHRQGQKHDKVFLHHIITRKTADEDILPVLQNRKVTEDRIKAAVKARLERAISGRKLAA